MPWGNVEGLRGICGAITSIGGAYQLLMEQVLYLTDGTGEIICCYFVILRLVN